MPMKEKVCPGCGSKTMVNDERPFSFCSQCGYKILLEETPRESSEIENDEIGEKLKEVEFYYQLSAEKKEYEQFEMDPVYYLKAQDLLIDLSVLYPDDYRIWWEMCKPVDYLCPRCDNEIQAKYQINENFFGKALDKAKLPQKKELIKLHDKYAEEKAAILKEKEALERAAAEKRRQEIERQQEAERIARERQQETEKIEKEREREERLRQEKEKEKSWQLGMEQSQPLWAALGRKDYSVIDNAVFTIPAENNQTILGIFKVVSNMLYLMAYRIDGNKSNMVYLEQTMSMKFDDFGHAKKFNNTPIRIRGFIAPNDELYITMDGRGGLAVNRLPLQINPGYVERIMKSAKKPMLPSAKKFI